MYDLIIIGAGPAGITAGVYAARKKMNFLVLTMDIGGQTVWSSGVENYTGYQFISGGDLAQKFESHMRQYAIQLHESERVTQVEAHDGGFSVRTDKQEYQARTVIIASGKRSKELGVPGEREFRNKGLTYCATCDGPLFSGKDVAVIGGGNSALDACLQLERIARRVYLIANASALGGDAVMREKVLQGANLTVLLNTNIAAVTGTAFVEGVRVRHEGNESDIPVQGVFVEAGLIPNADFVAAVKKNELGEIVVDCGNRTDIPGLFAAGDVSSVPDKQIIIAAGEGAKACLGAFRYLAQHAF